MTRRNGEIILFWRICHLDIFNRYEIDRYHNISLSLKNVMFVECLKFVLFNWYSVEFSGNQSNCRICILIGECCTGVESLEILELVEFVELPGKAGRS